MADEADRREAEREAALVERLRKGDGRALDELFRRHRDTAYGIAYRLVGSREDALDVVQEAFIHVMRGVQTFRGQSSFRTWLYRIVTHAALDYRRWRSLRTSETLDAEAMVEPTASGPSQRTPQEEAAARDLRQAIDKALMNISEKNRAALVLFAIEGMSYKEIADVLSISVGTVMSRIFNARQRLRELLETEIG
ncbi:MAG: sigma-70 family RNA polymerase sigma factor [Planctomycetota bacterium]|nr:sigma-70 family RNA polymerase sigma factor [Planctomycetota bacterium]